MTRTRYFAIPVVVAALAFGCEELPNIPPTASFIYSPVSPIFAGQTVVVFNASASRDPDGRVATYTWNFGDGTPPQSGDGPVTSHVFPNTPATCLVVTYAVLLTAIDDRGEQGTATSNVQVTEDCR